MLAVVAMLVASGVASGRAAVRVVEGRGVGVRANVVRLFFFLF